MKNKKRNNENPDVSADEFSLADWEKECREMEAETEESNAGNREGLFNALGCKGRQDVEEASDQPYEKSGAFIGGLSGALAGSVAGVVLGGITGAVTGNSGFFLGGLKGAFTGLLAGASIGGVTGALVERKPRPKVPYSENDEYICVGDGGEPSEDLRD